MFYRKEKIFLMTRIIITILFLTFSSYIWFNLKDFTVYKTNTRENIIVSENITFSSLKQVSDNDVLKLKYIINDGEIHSLNMDGIVYIDNIEKEEVKDISLKIWISDTYNGSLNYSGRVIVN